MMKYRYGKIDKYMEQREVLTRLKVLDWTRKHHI